MNYTGAGLAWFGAIALVWASWSAGDAPLKQLSFGLHGVGLIAMLNFSALYHHRAWDWDRSHELICLDHVITSVNTLL